ncbi:hypothetical protein OF113_11470 [Ectopseudomonas chengduensis]|nr:hypothetical protein [Pseudomonas chengduensis]UZT80627.1 hypothetical protein OF113_11470 [Pseudomonas chengduensis]
MSSSAIDLETIVTAKMLAIRLGTVSSALKPDGSAVPLFARINGERHALTVDNFQVDDDGTLLFLSNTVPVSITVLEAWEAIGHDTGVNPSKDELLDSLRYMSRLATTLSEATNPAVNRVLAERIRQIQEHGYDSDHDDDHACDEIAALATYYAMPPSARYWDATSTGYGATLGEAILPEGWTAKPWDGEEAGRIRELVKAGALIVAELERLLRAEERYAEQADEVQP